jgi:hypothetical protein
MPRLTSVAVVVLALTSASLPASPDPVALVINGESFTRNDFEAVVDEVRGLANRVGSVPASLRPVPAIVEAVDRLVIAQAATQRGYILSDAQFERVLANGRERTAAAENESFEATLKHYSLSLETLRRILERQLAYDRLRLDVVNSVEISEDEAREHYEAHRAEFALSSFEQSKARIARALLTPERQAQEWEAYVKLLRTQAVIEWRDDRLRRAYEAAITSG